MIKLKGRLPSGCGWLWRKASGAERVFGVFGALGGFSRVLAGSGLGRVWGLGLIGLRTLNPKPETPNPKPYSFRGVGLKLCLWGGFWCSLGFRAEGLGCNFSSPD